MKKTWLSYPLWLLYAVLAGVSIITNLLWFGIHVWGIGRYLTAAAIAAAFCLAAGIWFAGHRLAFWMEGKPSCIRFGKMAEYVLLPGLCLAAAACRLYLLAFSFAGNIEGGFFYDMASVKAGGGVPWMAHGASYIYTRALSFVLSFTGNKAAAGAALQLILQLIAIIVFYAAVRLLTGRIEALCTLAVLAFARNLCSSICFLTPETLYFLLYAVGLLLCGLYGKRTAGADGDESGNVRKYIFPAVCGVYIGYMGFLDVAGWTLLLPAAGICVRNLTEQGGKRKLIPFAVCAGAAAAAAFLALGADAWSAGYSYGERLSMWLDCTVQTFALKNIFIFMESGKLFSRMRLMTALCGALAAIGFWFSEKQKQDIWIILLLLLTICQVSGFGGMDYGFLYTAVWGILAGIGISSMGKGQEAIVQAEDAGQKESAVQAEGVGQKECAARAEDAGQKERAARAEGTGQEEGAARADGTGQKERAAMTDAAEEEQKGGQVEAGREEKPKVKFIENPLPLPKKHVKREMTYAKEITETEMDFDIPVNENDDFDI